MILLIAALVIWAAMAVHHTSKPSYQGHRLSEWLDAFDDSLRFDEGDGRRKFSDVEIRTALSAIGDRAFPQLMKWVRAKDS